MNPDMFKYKGAAVPFGTRSPLYPMPTYEDWILKGFEAWPELYRRSDNVVDFRLVAPSEGYCRKCDYIEARFTTQTSLLELLGKPNKNEFYSDFDVNIYEYSDLVWIALKDGFVNSIMLSQNRDQPNEKPAWSFVFVSRA